MRISLIFVFIDRENDTRQNQFLMNGFDAIETFRYVYINLCFLSPVLHLLMNDAEIKMKKWHGPVSLKMNEMKIG